VNGLELRLRMKIQNVSEQVDWVKNTKARGRSIDYIFNELRTKRLPNINC